VESVLSDSVHRVDSSAGELREEVADMIDAARDANLEMSKTMEGPR